MNKITRMTVTAITVVSALGAGSAVASAAPTTAADHVLSTEIMPGVQYTSSTADQSVVIETATATLVAAGGQFQVRDASGATVAGVPAFPTEPKALTAVHAAPEVRAAARAATPELHLENIDGDPQTERFDAAIQAAINEFGLATSVGTMTGGLIGLAVGCGVGAVAGAVFGAPVLDAAGLTLIAGCLAGAGVLGGMGAILGAALLGIPVGIASAIKFQHTMNQPYEQHTHDSESN
ncbi:hypothetical protein ACGF5S_30900 [Nocardia nova]|uniref:hypothetical protein n=1 Tax=Nocardia nova TaxID=37330 RepID=UPI000CEA2537|nr:hypothetical protein C5E44_22470 [Nocardia nova]